jgi:hypothetical protein
MEDFMRLSDKNGNDVQEGDYVRIQTNSISGTLIVTTQKVVRSFWVDTKTMEPICYIRDKNWERIDSSRIELITDPYEILALQMEE